MNSTIEIACFIWSCLCWLKKMVMFYILINSSLSFFYFATDEEEGNG